MDTVLMESSLGLPVRRGKVRDVYDLGDRLLIVATDRISAFDVVMSEGIPDKGRLLTALSLFWLEKFGPQFPHHLISTNVEDYPASVRPYADVLRGRSMLVRKAQVVPIECVARGYLAGSGWTEYQAARRVCGVELPAGLRQGDKLPAPIFTPATKESVGHDLNISFEQLVQRVGRETAEVLRRRTLDLYQQAAEYAASRGIIIADTKFEFGFLPGGQLILIDEVLTPDSSRFWPADRYQPGADQPSFDKQFLRDYLESQPWDKKPPPPALPQDVIFGTRERYIEAYERLTGRIWVSGAR